MRKLQAVLVAAMLAGTSNLAAAQDAQQQGQRPGGQNRMVALLQGITLSAEQQAKVDTLGTKYQSGRASLMQDQSLDQDARRAKSREMMTKQMDDVKAILTDEQKKVFEKNVADMQARMQGGGRPPQN
jgi:Spy/CpxP family protein refolding chaperone